MASGQSNLPPAALLLQGSDQNTVEVYSNTWLNKLHSFRIGNSTCIYRMCKKTAASLIIISWHSICEFVYHEFCVHYFCDLFIYVLKLQYQYLEIRFLHHLYIILIVDLYIKIWIECTLVGGDQPFCFKYYNIISNLIKWFYETMAIMVFKLHVRIQLGCGVDSPYKF